MANKNPFKYFKTSPEIIRLTVMFYVRYPLSYRQVEDILHERGIDICHETVRFWVGRFGLKFASIFNSSFVRLVSEKKRDSAPPQSDSSMLPVQHENFVVYPLSDYFHNNLER